MPTEENPNFIIREISNTDKVNKLKLRTDDGALGTFLRRDALPYHEKCYAKTYVVVDDNTEHPQKVVAYISILNSELQKEMFSGDPDKEYKYSYPCVKLARLAVDLKLQRSGFNLGRKLVDFVIALITIDIMSKVGCKFLVLDANKPAIEFYKKQGFTLVDTPENLAKQTPIMFMDLTKLLPRKADS